MFSQQAVKNGSLMVDSPSNVFKGVKIPFGSLDSLPADFSKSLGYEFYILEDGVPLELNPE